MPLKINAEGNINHLCLDKTVSLLETQMLVTS